MFSCYNYLNLKAISFKNILSMFWKKT
uniref:Uncharacterized protein n=1 Tax=Anguilla anguilla TaxID=7936 RepID=A0A0E9S015_ANGAN